MHFHSFIISVQLYTLNMLHLPVLFLNRNVLDLQPRVPQMVWGSWLPFAIFSVVCVIVYDVKLSVYRLVVYSLSLYHVHTPHIHVKWQIKILVNLMLCVPTTPIRNNLPSPAELIFGRKNQSVLPTVSLIDLCDHIKDDLHKLCNNALMYLLIVTMNLLLFYCCVLLEIKLTTNLLKHIAAYGNQGRNLDPPRVNHWASSTGEFGT